MKPVQARALGLDALHQVLDNRVFRILALVALLPIAFSFLVAFEPDRIEVLFGWKSWSYDFLGTSTEDPRAAAVDTWVRLVVDTMGGSLGVLVCLVATSFFVPQMIERGAADVLFHKPLARATFYLARYVSGLLFVALLALFLCAGVWTGLRVVSGWNDPGILLGAFTLTYAFALVYPVSMLAGVLTKSPVASILVTLLFLFANGCVVHEGWMIKESWLDGQRATLGEDAPDPLEELGAAARAAARVADVLHLTLPRTGDAKLIARELRRRVTRLPYEDADTGVALVRLPEGARPVEPEPLAPYLAEAFGPARLALAFDAEDARAGLHRLERARNGSAREAAEDLLARLRAAGHPDAERRSAILGTGRASSAAQLLVWTEGGRRWSAYVLRAGERIYTLWIEEPGEEPAGGAATGEDGREPPSARLAAALGVHPDEPSSAQFWVAWYRARAGFHGPPSTNLGFSIASSLAFAAVVLLLGCVRLRRIDF